MGLYHSLKGRLNLSRASYEMFLSQEIDGENDIQSLLKYGQYSFFERDNCLAFDFETKRNYLFTGLFKASAYYKDTEGIDKIQFLSDSTDRMYVEEIQIKAGAYRFFDPKRKKVIYNLHKKDGWEHVRCLVQRLTRDFQKDTIEILGKKGERFSLQTADTDLMLYTLENIKEFETYELEDAGTSVRWPGILTDSFDINRWIDQSTSV